MPAIVNVIDLYKNYYLGSQTVRVLQGLNLSFDEGDFVALMGPSGSGKSTLLHIVGGLETATSGALSVVGVRCDALDDRELTRLRREHIGFIFQAYNLLPVLTAEENVTLPLRIGGAEVDRAWFDEIIAAVGLGDRLHHRPSELSGGQQQRVAVARALMARPDVLFADEPTGNLDSVAGGEVLELLREAADRYGQTIVMVTHEPGAAAIADAVIHLVDGRVVDGGP